MTERIWQTSYPAGVPADVDLSQYNSLADLMEESFRKYKDRTAYSYLGKDISYNDINTLGRALACYFQSVGLRAGDRVGVMLPNLPQYPIAITAALRAGLVVVNINPMYTSRELDYQLRDADVRALVIAESCLPALTPDAAGLSINSLIVCRPDDALTLPAAPSAKSAGQLPQVTMAFNDALAAGSHKTLQPTAINPEDIAVLQYTGGTTGISKGAMLSHRNLIANVLQFEAWNEPAMRDFPADEQPTNVCALPMYHIFAFTLVVMLSMRTGGKTIIIPNARDLSAMLKELSQHVFHELPGVNTLYNGLLNHPDFGTVNWSNLRVCVGGGSSIQRPVAERWYEETGCPIREGYGLTETSPTACANPAVRVKFNGTIGIPLPNTLMKLIDDEEREVPIGQAGEIAIKGPQVMLGYWRRPDETAKVMTADGYFKSGDIGIMDELGYLRIVDRKKDVILVSGFNVYPNEIEEVVASMPGVMECAAVGVPAEKTGEAVKLVVVKKDPELTQAEIIEYCSARLTSYKRPKLIEFRADLPKTAVGKILRRQLRQQ